MLLGHLLDEGGQVGVGVRAQDEDLEFEYVILRVEGDNQLFSYAS